MSIKLTAVDMDGTFSNGQETYNHERFMTQYRQMKEQGIRFAVASGNQYYQSISFFPELANEISFVAENGSQMISEREDVFNDELAKDDFHAIVDHLLTRADIDIITCGKNSAYTLKQYSDERKNVSAIYYHRLEFVDNFDNLSGVFSRFGLNISDDRIPQVQADPHEAVGDVMIPVHTDYGSIGLIIPGVHEANSLHLLQQRWNTSDDEVVVLGDGGNDIEMLRQTGFSFAMANAHEPVIRVVRYRIGSNNEEGVPDITGHVLKNETPFTY